MAIRFFDMFAGIGGFRSGLEAVGGFQCIGHCEIDKYANQAYNAIYKSKGEMYFEDARTIDPNDLSNLDLICAGFPCQSFSVAGKRLGFADDTRGTLFFEIARIAEAKRPPFLLMENVPGLLSHDAGRTFKTILSTLIELGYGVEWCVHNRLIQQAVTIYVEKMPEYFYNKKLYTVSDSIKKQVENKKSKIGGQALIEGIMMIGVYKGAMACRLPDGTIDVETWALLVR